MSASRLTRIGPGVYADEEGTMHLDLPELLRANGYDDTPENRETLTRTASAMFAEMGIPVTDAGLQRW